MKKIICTVTNDLTYDQRMQRICTTLAKNGYEVKLVGRRLANSKPLDQQIFQQTRLPNFFKKGFLFYAEHNLRLFFFLIFKKYDCLWTVDLDTMPGGCTAAMLRRKRRIFDAHEYFTEVPEVVGRPTVQKFWAVIAQVFTKKYHAHITVGDALAEIFTNKYGVKFQAIRNVPKRLAVDGGRSEPSHQTSTVIFYQGALNVGRGIEQAILAMEKLPEVELWLAGEGDLSKILREKAAASHARERIKFLGFVKPTDLKRLTNEAWLGLNLLENRGQSYYFSLANKFFDYVQAGVPGLTMDFPEYRKLVEEHPVAVLLPDLQVENIIAAIRDLLDFPEKYEALHAACRHAAEFWTWENEEKKVLRILAGQAPLGRR